MRQSPSGAQVGGSSLPRALTQDFRQALGFDNARVSQRYRAAFAAAGLIPGSPNPAEAGEWMQGRRALDLVTAALENWATSTPDLGEQRALIAVLRASEPDPNAFRRRWLDAWEGRMRKKECGWPGR